MFNLFRRHYNIPLIHRDAGDLFLAKLAGVTDPEEKRKRIGAVFIDVFDEEAQKLGDVEFLAQGTLYPDVIESTSAIGGPSVTIKSHHNVGGLPERMKLRLVEPLRELFKDEVRALGRDGEPFEVDADGLLAVCIQHEMDHLEGKLFVDYLSEMKRERIRKKLEKERKERATAAPAGAGRSRRAY